MGDGNWTLNVLVGGPILTVLIVGLITTAIITYRQVSRNDLAWGGRKTKDGLFLAGIPTVVAFALIILTIIAYFPFQKDYNYWTPVSGQVQQIDKRLVSDGNSNMNERYVLTIDGQPYGVDDTRAATIRKGDEVQLSCKKEWQWQSTPGWGCRWVGKE